MDIKVLGSGCAKCKTLEKVTREAVEQLNLAATIEKVEDIQKIIEYGVMITPALVVDGEVVDTIVQTNLNWDASSTASFEIQRDAVGTASILFGFISSPQVLQAP